MDAERVFLKAGWGGDSAFMHHETGAYAKKCSEKYVCGWGACGGLQRVLLCNFPWGGGRSELCGLLSPFCVLLESRV